MDVEAIPDKIHQGPQKLISIKLHSPAQCRSVRGVQGARYLNLKSCSFDEHFKWQKLKNLILMYYT